MPDERDLERLNDLLDDRLPAGEADVLRRRLAAEPALAEAYEELERVGAMARGFDPAAALEPPAGFGAAVRDRIAQQAAPRPSGREADGRPPLRLASWMAIAYAAAAVLVVGVVLVWAIMGPGLGPESTVETARGPEPAREPGGDGRGAPSPAASEKTSPAALDALTEQARKHGGRGDRLGAPEVGAAEVQETAEPPVRAPLRPGGVVPPGLRAPSDTPAPSGRAARPRARVYVLAFAEPEGAAEALRSVLVAGTAADEEALARLTRQGRFVPVSPALLDGLAPPQSGPAARFAEAEELEEADEAPDEAADLLASLAVVATIESRLSPAAVERLDALAAASVTRRGRAEAERGAGGPTSTPPAPSTPTTPTTPPEAPTEPARAPKKPTASTTPTAPNVPAQEPATDAGRPVAKRRARGDAAGADEGDDDEARAADRDAAAAVLVRILVVRDRG